MKDNYYCCKNMEELDKKKIIDYCPPNLTTLDVKRNGYPIYFCPFCGKKIRGSKESVKKLKKILKNMTKRKVSEDGK